MYLWLIGQIQLNVLVNIYNQVHAKPQEEIRFTLMLFQVIRFGSYNFVTELYMKTDLKTCNSAYLLSCAKSKRDIKSLKLINQTT